MPKALGSTFSTVNKIKYLKTKPNPRLSTTFLEVLYSCPAPAFHFSLVAQWVELTLISVLTLKADEATGLKLRLS